MMRAFEFAALSPPRLADPAIAIAASRASALGILDLEYIDDYQVARDAIARMVHYSPRPCGIRLDGESAKFAEQVLAGLPDEIATVILTCAPRDALEELCSLIGDGIRVLLQTTNVEQARLGIELGVDGLIAKGHESAGRVGDETTFVLLQRLLSQTSLPVWAEGGIGLHTVAACYAAGAAGVLLGSQLALTRESPLSETTKGLISRLDGSETILIGEEVGDPHRVYARPRLTVIDELHQRARSIGESTRDRSQWRDEIRARAGWGDPDTNLWILGQDAAFAGQLAAEFHTVGGVITGMRDSISKHVSLAATLKPLDENSPLAESLGLRYPIAQGPMTRVSDRAAFAADVAEQGGLPFLALALLRAPEVKSLLEETRELLGDRPWGVGILGFVPLELRQEQLEVIRAYSPPYALIAGGRPDQANALEQDSIPTFLHVPSPNLLRLFLEAGSRKFVFEGRECGGHVGPRTSFVLWDLMIDVLLESLPENEIVDCHVLFAGGVHDSRSASMVACMAAPLADRGAKVGVLMGTAYTLTKEAVSSGAIVAGFQEEALRCAGTTLLETGPGHATRCAMTPFAEQFTDEKLTLTQQGLPAEEIRNSLEQMNLGRLRIATKGVTRNDRYRQDPDAPKLVTVDEDGQHAQGMYMIGQVAALHHAASTIATLHQEVSVKGSERLETLTDHVTVRDASQQQPLNIAIIGMSCVLPKAPDIETYWDNILDKVYAITEIPKTRWDWELYFDPERRAKDKIYSKWGGFIDPVLFDPVEFGMPPNSLLSIDPMQILALQAARDALQDAGYSERAFDRGETSVVLGTSGGLGDLGMSYVLRSSLPLILGEQTADVVAGAGESLPEWTEDSFAGLLPNVAAGRIANRLDLGGLNYIVDAACASSLAALYTAVNELQKGNTNQVIVGGVDTIQSPFGYMCFSKTQALSPNGRPRTFDAEADGIVIGEGLVMLVLKRLEDAERDGDRIYAVIRGMGGSSDGKAMGLTAPRIEGQVRALQRAYAQADFSPDTVGLFEAHGTGTVVGDRTEALSLAQFLNEAGSEPQSTAIGSVKSMIGHTKATAGVAGLAKVALALYHKVLPPTLGVTEPNPSAGLHDGPLYVNSETRPWIHGVSDHARRAGVSSFGFGGTNFHAVLEEYTGDFLPSTTAPAQRWPSELFRWSAATRDALDGTLEQLQQALAEGAKPKLCDLALLLEHSAPRDNHVRLAIVASSWDDLQQKLAVARDQLGRADVTQFQDPRGIYFSAAAPDAEAKVAYLFPGQGSQYPDMLGDLAVHFPEIREAIERADRYLADRFPDGLSARIFPPPRFQKFEEQLAREALSQTNVAQPALGAVSSAMAALLANLGLQPNMAAGHSYGEYVALFAGGAFDEQMLYRISEARGRFIIEAAEDDLGTMAAAGASSNDVTAAIDGLEGVWIANRNAPNQTVISGTKPGIDEAIERLSSRDIRTTRFAVSCAFHSPLVAPAKERLGDFLASCPFRATQFDVFSNTTATPYPPDPTAMVDRLREHLVKPVEFTSEIEAMYRAGARVFVEVGPGNVLTGLTRRILGDQPHTAVATNVAGRPGLVQLLHCLAQLTAIGVPVKCQRLYQGRAQLAPTLASLVENTRAPTPAPTAWLVDGGRARRVQGGSSPAAAEQTRPVAVTKPKQDASKPANLVTKQPVPVAITEPTVSETPTPRSGKTLTPSQPVVPSPSAPPSPAPSEALVGVMQQYQQLMNRFLDTQQQVMLKFLNNSSSAGPVPLPLPAATAAHHAAALEPMEVSPPIAQDEPAEKEPVTEDLPEPAPSEVPAEASQDESVDADGMTTRLLELVSERTGYPTEMLDLDLDIEAELGIDSIKRVEILAMLQSNCMPEGWDAEESAMEELLKIKTMRGIVEWMVDAAAEVPLTSQARATEGSAAGSGQSGKSVADRDQLTAKLLELVSERTGYPTEMLDLDLDLEAELGIDSIKRVEVLAMLQSNCMPDGWEAGESAMEELLKIRTMRGIANWMADAVDGQNNGQAPAANGQATSAVLSEPLTAHTGDEPAGTNGSDSTDGRCHVPRFLFSMMDASMEAASLPAIHGVILVTDDELGVAEALVNRLRERSVAAVRVRLSDAFSAEDQQTCRANLTDPTSIRELLEHVADAGPVAGIVHLMPLRDATPFEELDLSSWQTRIREELKSLFYLAQAAGADIRSVGKDSAAWVIAATRMGGTLGCSTEHVSSFFPGHGGLAGFIKTLALEWTDVNCKLVDVDDAMVSHPANFTTVLVDEMARESRREEIEVGYCDGRRRIPRPIRAEFTPGESEAKIDSDSVLMITGGARGITAAVACDLALRYRPTMLVAGRSPEPPANESPETASLSGPQDLKRAIIEQLGRAGQTPAPAQVEVAYNRLCKEREIRENLNRMRDHGATVEYYQVDVRDEVAFGGLVDQIYERYGRIDGVIHGAGVIEDKLVELKTDDSFERVLETKTNSAFVLGRKLRGESLKFLVFFSSMAGRFGNRGQADYAAANEILNKLAVALARQWSARVVAMNWGPWLTGMVSPEIKQQFEKRGVQLIPPTDGARVLNDEITYGSSSEIEVVLGGGPWEAYATTGVASAATDSLPLLVQPPVVGNGGVIETSRLLDVHEDLFLRDHVLDGKPVFPLAMAMELAAEVAQQGWPDLKVIGLRSISLLNGIVLNDGPKQIKAVAKPQTDPAHESLDLEVSVEISESSRENRPSYRCNVLLSDRFPPAPAHDLEPFAQLKEMPLKESECYERWLFHGPCFQGIMAVLGIGEFGVSGDFSSTSPAECLASEPAGTWLVDPVVLDCGFQLGILWERLHYDMTPLPARIDAYHRFGSFDGQPVRCYFVAKPSMQGRILCADIYFHGPDGKLISMIENMQTACSKELNRLAGSLSGVNHV